MTTARQDLLRPSALRAMGRALTHHNYRLFFIGQGISLVGTWMTRLATGWLVFRLDREDAGFMLGMVGFAGQIPAFFLAPLAGVLVDRWSRHRLLVITQVLSLAQSALLAWLAFEAQPGPAALLQVMALAVLQGFINAFDMPARQSFLVEMIEAREDLPNAIALNSSLVNGARLVGPALAGALIALTGDAWCFVLDALSYVAVLVSLLRMRLRPRPAADRAEPLLARLAEGFRYSFGFAPIRALLLLLALVSFMGMPYSVLLPLFATDILNGGPYTLGFLSSAAGVGALSGAIYLASRTTVLGLGRQIVHATCLFGLGLIGFGLSEKLWLSLLLMVVIGFGMMVQMAASNTILQTIVDEDKRGRVMSFYSMAFLGMAPFGSLFAGLLARRVGPEGAVLAGGVACLLGAGVFAASLPRLRTHVRPIYTRLGILPEVATGMLSATDLPQPPRQ